MDISISAWGRMNLMVVVGSSFGGFIVIGCVLVCMVSSMSEADEWKALISIPIVALVGFVVLGGLVAVFSHQFVLDVLPASSEWSPIVGWTLSGVLGYIVASAVMSIGALLFFG